MLDTPPSALNRVQLHHKDYYETSGFSPVSREVLVITTLLTVNVVHVCACCVASTVF